MSKSSNCVFVSYNKEIKGWKFYELTTRKQFTSRDVIWNEAEFPYAPRRDILIPEADDDEDELSAAPQGIPAQVVPPLVVPLTVTQILVPPSTTSSQTSRPVTPPSKTSTSIPSAPTTTRIETGRHYQLPLPPLPASAPDSPKKEEEDDFPVRPPSTRARKQTQFYKAGSSSLVKSENDEKWDVLGGFVEEESEEWAWANMLEAGWSYKFDVKDDNSEYANVKEEEETSMLQAWLCSTFIDKPKNYREAMASPNDPKWTKAMDTEI
ncbi:hypothetical protein FRC02_003146 [Tulasnella sp. 418]|nr:hypothetical protein FRC02_003146 [Tulasnella sp. 418]